MQNRFSPLRYPGGKGKITGYIRSVFELNNLVDGHYVEPFAGGAAVALGLLFTECVRKIHINDIDRSIYAFWHSVLNEPDELCRLIRQKRLSISEWKRQKAIQKEKANVSLIELGFSTFYLNRTNRSGIINGGVIGGLDQSGEWKIDARFNKVDLILRIEKIAAFSGRICLHNLDACAFLSKIGPTLPLKTLVYLDPPYFYKGNRLYHSFYKPHDHEFLSKWIMSNLQNNWLVSYDNVEQIEKAYSGKRMLRYSIGYSARKSYRGSEIMIFSDGLIMPTQTHPLADAA